MSFSIPYPKEESETPFHLPFDFDLDKAQHPSDKVKNEILNNTLLINSTDDLSELDAALSKGVVYAIDTEWESTFQPRKTLTSIIQISILNADGTIKNVVVDLLSFVNGGQPKPLNGPAIALRNPSPLVDCPEALLELDKILSLYFHDKNRILIGHQFYNDSNHFKASYPQLKFHNNIRVLEVQMLLTYLVPSSHPFFQSPDITNNYLVNGSDRFFYNSAFVISLQKVVALSVGILLKKGADHASWCYRPIKEHLLFYAVCDTYYLLKSFVRLYGHIDKIYGPDRALMILFGQKVNTPYIDRSPLSIDMKSTSIDSFISQKALTSRMQSRRNSCAFEIVALPKTKNSSNKHQITTEASAEEDAKKAQELEAMAEATFFRNSMSNQTLQPHQFVYSSATVKAQNYSVVYKTINTSSGFDSIYKERFSKTPTYLFNPETKFSYSLSTSSNPSKDSPSFDMETMHANADSMLLETSDSETFLQVPEANITPIVGGDMTLPKIEPKKKPAPILGIGEVDLQNVLEKSRRPQLAKLSLQYFQKPEAPAISPLSFIQRRFITFLRTIK